VIVLIADHHMSRIYNIRIARIWNKRQKRFGNFFAYEVAHTPSDQMDRAPNAPSGVFQSVKSPLLLWRLHIRDETWVPMPSVATVGSEPQILGETVQVSASLAIGKIGGNDVGRFIDGFEAVLSVSSHEAHDTIYPRHLHSWRDINQRHAGKGPRRFLAFSNKRGESPEGGADYRRRATEMSSNCD